MYRHTHMYTVHPGLPGSIVSGYLYSLEHSLTAIRCRYNQGTLSICVVHDGGGDGGNGGGSDVGSDGGSVWGSVGGSDGGSGGGSGGGSDGGSTC